MALAGWYNAASGRTNRFVESTSGKVRVAMDGHQPRIAEGAFLHWVLGITPGYAPVWLCSRNSCEGIDLLTPIAPAMFICMIILAVRVGLWTWLICLPLLMGCLVLVVPFESRERLGRARRRRGECVWCGWENIAPGAACSQCGRIAKAGGA